MAIKDEYLLLAGLGLAAFLAFRKPVTDVLEPVAEFTAGTASSLNRVTSSAAGATETVGDAFRRTTDSGATFVVETGNLASDIVRGIRGALDGRGGIPSFGGGGTISATPTTQPRAAIVPNIAAAQEQLRRVAANDFGRGILRTDVGDIPTYTVTSPATANTPARITQTGVIKSAVTSSSNNSIRNTLNRVANPWN